MTFIYVLIAHKYYKNIVGQVFSQKIERQRFPLQAYVEIYTECKCKYEVLKER